MAGDDADGVLPDRVCGGELKPILLDTFCKAGGCTKGYQRAGFFVVGVDIKPQPHYCGDAFVQMDALEALRILLAGGFIIDTTGHKWYLSDFAAIHASPPCQGYSITKYTHHNEYPELIDDVRDLLILTKIPWVIENVVGAPLLNPFTLCGTMFGLNATDNDGTPLFLRRHRLFESSLFIFMADQCQCSKLKNAGMSIGGVYGGGSCDRNFAKNERRGGYTPKGNIRRVLMGIDWMNQDELSEAIPPVFTEFIGRQLIAQLQGEN